MIYAGIPLNPTLSLTQQAEQTLPLFTLKLKLKNVEKENQPGLQGHDHEVTLIRQGCGMLENPDRIFAGVRTGVDWSENPDRIFPGVRNGDGWSKNPDRIFFSRSLEWSRLE